MKRTLVAVAIACTVLGAMSTGVQAASKHHDPPCTITPSPAIVGQPYTVSASGIPTLVPVNLFVTAPNGTTTGSPLGSTPDGTFNLSETSNTPGTWSYEFTGVVKSSNTTVYATCSVTVS